MITEQDLYTHTGTQYLNLLFPGKCLETLYPDISSMKPGSWSNYCHEVTIELNDEPTKIDINLYREPLTKNGTSRQDDDPKCDIDYAGRLTIQTFISDNGDVIGPCIDLGLPEKYIQEKSS